VEPTSAPPSTAAIYPTNAEYKITDKVQHPNSGGNCKNRQNSTAKFWGKLQKKLENSTAKITGKFPKSN
jgi:hypothetical protein